MQLRDLFQGYLDSCYRQGKKPSTIRGHRTMIQNIIGPVLGARPIEDLRPIDRDLILERASGYGKAKANQSVITFRRLLCFAKDSGIHLPFDWRDIEVPKYRRTTEVTALTKEEIERIRRSLTIFDEDYSKHASLSVRKRHEHAVLRTRCLFEVLLHTGLRLSEALSIKIEDVDFDSNELKAENVKTGEHQTVYLYGATKYIHDYLSYRIDESPWLFVSGSGRRLEYDTAQTCLKQMKRRVGLKKNLTHKIFRATFGTLLIDHGVDIKTVQVLMRHNSPNTTLNFYIAVRKKRCRTDHRRVMSRV